MLKNKSQLTTSFQFCGNGIESKIPLDEYEKLCNCVFCWNYFNIVICEKCNKKYCTYHNVNHLCFKESPIILSPILSSASSIFEREN